MAKESILFPEEHRDAVIVIVILLGIFGLFYQPLLVVVAAAVIAIPFVITLAVNSFFPSHIRTGRKNPYLAALLGVLITGSGLMYVDKWAEGIALLLIAIIVSVFTAVVTGKWYAGVLIALIFWIISAYWAYKAAQDYNRTGH